MAHPGCQNFLRSLQVLSDTNPKFKQSLDLARVRASQIELGGHLAWHQTSCKFLKLTMCGILLKPKLRRESSIPQKKMFLLAVIPENKLSIGSLVLRPCHYFRYVKCYEHESGPLGFVYKTNRFMKLHNLATTGDSEAFAGLNINNLLMLVVASVPSMFATEVYNKPATWLQQFDKRETFRASFKESWVSFERSRRFQVAKEWIVFCFQLGRLQFGSKYPKWSWSLRLEGHLPCITIWPIVFERESKEYLAKHSEDFWSKCLEGTSRQP